jgi:hypothetical protein
MWSNFYGERYSDAEFIGILDTDAFFAVTVYPEDLFENGKPRVIGYNGRGTGWEKAAVSAVGGDPLGEFMIALGFPFIVRREHFAPFRAHISRMAFGNETAFDAAFHRICSTYKTYSQFDMLAFYLWRYHRDEYAWHIRDNDEAHHPALNSRMSSDPEVLAVKSPKIGVMKHQGHRGFESMFGLLYTFVCVDSKFDHQGCVADKENRTHFEDNAQMNLLTDEITVLDGKTKENISITEVKSLFEQREEVIAKYNRKPLPVGKSKESQHHQVFLSNKISSMSI